MEDRVNPEDRGYAGTSGREIHVQLQLQVIADKLSEVFGIFRLFQYLLHGESRS